MEEIENKISLKNELLRKTIHLGSTLVPIIYYYVERDFAIRVLCIAVIILMLVDILRVNYPPFRRFYLKLTKPILRGHEISNERHTFTGATYITIAFLICVVIFPKPLAITSMFVVIICDSMAAIAGKVFGRHYIANKTFEGSFAFFLSGVIIILLTPKITDSVDEYYIGLFTVFLTSLFELVPVRFDDNVSIPIFFGLIYLLQVKIFL